MMYSGRYISVAIRHILAMPIPLKRKVVKIGGSLRLTLPPEVAEILKLQAGDTVEYVANNGDIIIRKEKKNQAR